MPAVRLRAVPIEKPWGRHELGAGFAPVAPGAPAVGEVRFDHPDDATRQLPLLVKYLFTSRPLSVQVHPDDAAARASGHARGKDEAWVVLEAAPDAVIGMGLCRPAEAAALRSAALDGSLATLLDWRQVHAGMTLYSPAGTIHAIGAGLTIVEIQQNLDLTFRLFDYGSDRPLQIDDAVAVAKPMIDLAGMLPYELAPGRHILVEGQKFVVERWQRDGCHRLASDGHRPTWIVPLAAAVIDGNPMLPGEAWFTDGPSTISCAAGSDLLLAYEGAAPFAEPASFGDPVPAGAGR